MANFLNHYMLKYTPLSPLHIGTGDSYEPTNYVIDDGTLYEFDTGAALAALSANDRTELLKITGGKPDTQMLKALQKFFYDRRNALKPWSVHAIPVLEGVAGLYQSRIGQSANREGGGGQVINRLEIDRTAYNPINRQPILFGSSIKGAIRTALLNHVNKGQSLSKQDADWFKIDDLDKYERRRYGREQKKVYSRLNERLFKFRAGKFELDPMRLLHVSDAAWINHENLPTAQVLITVNRKKHKVTNAHGSELLSQAEKKENLCKLLECVPPWHYRVFAGGLNIQLLNKLHAKNDDRLPHDDLRFSMKQIAKACCAFYLPILKAEMTLMRGRGFLDNEWDKNIQALLANMADKMQTGQIFLLRIGRHSGAEAVTLSGARNIKIIKGNPEYQEQTKTLWLSAEQPKQRSGLLPFGWVLVEVESKGVPANDWPELAELCYKQQAKARQWADKHNEQKAELEQIRLEALQRRKREETERILRTKRAQQEEQERLAKEHADQLRRAAMTPEQLQIDALKLMLRRKQASNLREQVGGPLYSDLREMIKQTEAWPGDAKAELLEVAKELLTFIGASSNKKAKELLKILQQ